MEGTSSPHNTRTSFRGDISPSILCQRYHAVSDFTEHDLLVAIPTTVDCSLAFTDPASAIYMRYVSNIVVIVHNVITSRVAASYWLQAPGVVFLGFRFSYCHSVTCSARIFRVHVIVTCYNNYCGLIQYVPTRVCS